MINKVIDLYADAAVVAYPEGDFSLQRDKEVFTEGLEDRNHIVKDGDNLLSIASYYYGNSRYWYLVADSNDLTIDNVFTLQTGVGLTIPHRFNI